MFSPLADPCRDILETSTDFGFIAITVMRSQCVDNLLSVQSDLNGGGFGDAGGVLAGWGICQLVVKNNPGFARNWMRGEELTKSNRGDFKGLW